MELSEHLKNIIVCPRCKSDLAAAADAFKCLSCGSAFPVVDGVMDFRLPGGLEAKPPFYYDAEYTAAAARLGQLHELYYSEKSLTGKLDDYEKQKLMSLVANGKRPFFDIGCGTGSDFKRLGYPDRVVGIDSSMDLLRKCKARYPEADCVCCDMINSPFRDASLETVFSSATLEHVFHLESFVRSIARVLSPSGWFYVLIPTEGGVLYKMLRLLAHRKYSGLLKIDYKKLMKKEHCNAAVTVENTLEKYFIIDRASRLPFGIGGNNFNIVVIYRLKKRVAG